MGVFISILLSFFADIVIRVSSGISLVRLKSDCKGIQIVPDLSTLAANFNNTVISRSVVLSVVSLSLTSNKTLLSIGRVDLAGVAFDSFWSAA